MMNRLISASGPKEVLSLLSTSKYNFYMDDKEFAYIEYYADSIQYNIAKRYMRFSNSAPLVYMTYSILQRIEIDNLKHIVEGIRYNQPVSKIENNIESMHRRGKMIKNTHLYNIVFSRDDYMEVLMKLENHQDSIYPVKAKKVISNLDHATSMEDRNPYNEVLDELYNVMDVLHIER